MTEKILVNFICVWFTVKKTYLYLIGNEKVER